MKAVKFVGGLFGALLITAVFVATCHWAGNFVDSHTLKYNCHNVPEGWQCDTKWKW